MPKVVFKDMPMLQQNTVATVRPRVILPHHQFPQTDHMSGYQPITGTLKTVFEEMVDDKVRLFTKATLDKQGHLHVTFKGQNGHWARDYKFQPHVLVKKGSMVMRQIDLPIIPITGRLTHCLHPLTCFSEVFQDIYRDIPDLAVDASSHLDIRCDIVAGS